MTKLVKSFEKLTKVTDFKIAKRKKIAKKNFIKDDQDILNTLYHHWAPFLFFIIIRSLSLGLSRFKIILYFLAYFVGFAHIYF